MSRVHTLCHWHASAHVLVIISSVYFFLLFYSPNQITHLFKDAYWTPWSSWSTECSTLCGVGEVKRTRQCEGVCQTSSAPCTPGRSDNDTSPCTAGTPAVWTTWEPTVCTPDVRSWTRACTPNCHGSCVGAEVDQRNCSWATLLLWAGPLRPHAAAQLTVAAVASDLAPPLREALVAALGGNPAVVGRLEPVVSSSQSEQRRRSVNYVDDSLTTRPGLVAGTVWTAVTAYILPDVREAITLVLPVVANATGAAAADLSKGGLVLAALQPAVTSPTSQAKGTAAATVGAVVGCILLLVLLLILFARHRRRHAQFVSNTVKGGVLASEEQQAQGWMLSNPAFKAAPPRSMPGPPAPSATSPAHSSAHATEASTQSSSEAVLACLTINPAYQSASNDAVVSERSGLQPNAAYISADPDHAMAGTSKTDSVWEDAAYLTTVAAAPALPPRDEIYYASIASISGEDSPESSGIYASALPGTVCGPPRVPPRNDTYIAIAATTLSSRDVKAESDTYDVVSDDCESAPPVLPPRVGENGYLAIGIASPRSDGALQSDFTYEEVPASGAADLPARTLPDMYSNPGYVSVDGTRHVEAAARSTAAATGRDSSHA